MDAREPLISNNRIAAALIDELLLSSDRPAARRALEAAGGDAAVRAHGRWLPPETLSAMFQAAAGDPRLAERVGGALVRSPQAGFLLRYGGLATPERAYRSSDRILPREARGGIYEVAEVESGRATVVYHPAAGSPPERCFCSLRRGMLEAIPLAYGLLPGRVRESVCASRGGACCTYEVRWSRGARQGLVAGGLIGMACGLALAWWAGLAPWAMACAAVAGGALTAAAGRSLDLARQLDAVAGARRGQLALLDQADRSLAEKMDQFARFDAAERGAGDSGATSQGGLAPAGAEEPHRGFQPVDLVDVVRRAVESQGSLLAALPNLTVELPDEPLMLDGEPIQLEMIVVQLIRNAAAAAMPEDPAGEAGRVVVRLAPLGERHELCVEDDGPGMEEETVDEVSDPFVSGSPSAESRGLGLSVVQRVLKEHGGELRLESAPGQGTRITALLPGSDRA